MFLHIYIFQFYKVRLKLIIMNVLRTTYQISILQSSIKTLEDRGNRMPLQAISILQSSIKTTHISPKHL